MDNKEELLEENIEEKPEKIEIVEHKESKYDDLKPRTEMAEMSEEEKEKIRAEVLEKETKIEEQEKVKLDKPSKGSNPLKTIAIIMLILVIGFFLFIYSLLLSKD